MLAGPGVFIGTGLVGICMKYFFPYNWNWSQCLMFGAMMSATDPVAVVALLKEVSLLLWSFRTWVVGICKLTVVDKTRIWCIHCINSHVEPRLERRRSWGL